jgi:membrane associated rhomboid family serine protease
MIIPWLKGFLDWEKAPITWTLLALNIFIFMVVSEAKVTSAHKNFSNVSMMTLTGKLFYQFSNPEKNELPFLSINEWIVLGGQGLKNAEFLEKSQTFRFWGDEIAIKDWKTKVVSYQDSLNRRSVTVFGLRGESSPVSAWITYQFMHASLWHLLGNMMMLLIFSATLELAVGGVAVIAIYLASGFAGAAMFVFLGQENVAPMIGASGSLSGIMAFYAAYEKRTRVSFFYFVSPIQGFFGWIHLPTLLIFPLCFLSDFSSYLSTPEQIGTGIAFTAHIGGSIFGAAAGFAVKYFRKSLLVRWLAQH